MIKNKFFALLVVGLWMVGMVTGCGLADHLPGTKSNVEVTMTEASHGIYQISLDDTKIEKVPYVINEYTT